MAVINLTQSFWCLHFAYVACMGHQHASLCSYIFLAQYLYFFYVPCYLALVASSTRLRGSSPQKAKRRNGTACNSALVEHLVRPHPFHASGLPWPPHSAFTCFYLFSYGFSVACSCEPQATLRRFCLSICLYMLFFVLLLCQLCQAEASITIL